MTKEDVRRISKNKIRERIKSSSINRFSAVIHRARSPYSPNFLKVGLLKKKKPPAPEDERCRPAGPETILQDTFCFAEKW